MGVGGEQTAAAELNEVIKAMEGEMLQRDDAALGGAWQSLLAMPSTRRLIPVFFR
jgi:hypothetical protein